MPDPLDSVFFTNPNAAQARLVRRRMLAASRARAAAVGLSRVRKEPDWRVEKDVRKPPRMLSNRQARKLKDDQKEELEVRVDSLEEENRRLRHRLICCSETKQRRRIRQLQMQAEALTEENDRLHRELAELRDSTEDKGESSPPLSSLTHTGATAAMTSDGISIALSTFPSAPGNPIYTDDSDSCCCICVSQSFDTDGSSASFGMVGPQRDGGSGTSGSPDQALHAGKSPYPSRSTSASRSSTDHFNEDPGSSERKTEMGCECETGTCTDKDVMSFYSQSEREGKFSSSQSDMDTAGAFSSYSNKDSSSIPSQSDQGQGDGVVERTAWEKSLRREAGERAEGAQNKPPDLPLFCNGRCTTYDVDHDTTDE